MELANVTLALLKKQRLRIWHKKRGRGEITARATAVVIYIRSKSNNSRTYTKPTTETIFRVSRFQIIVMLVFSKKPRSDSTFIAASYLVPSAGWRQARRTRLFLTLAERAYVKIPSPLL